MSDFKGGYTEGRTQWSLVFSLSLARSGFRSLYRETPRQGDVGSHSSCVPSLHRCPVRLLRGHPPPPDHRVLFSPSLGSTTVLSGLHGPRLTLSGLLKSVRSVEAVVTEVEVGERRGTVCPSQEEKERGWKTKRTPYLSLGPKEQDGSLDSYLLHRATCP